MFLGERLHSNKRRRHLIQDVLAFTNEVGLVLFERDGLEDFNSACANKRSAGRDAKQSATLSIIASNTRGGWHSSTLER